MQRHLAPSPQIEIYNTPGQRMSLHYQPGLSQPQRQYISSSCCYPEPKFCLTKAHLLDSGWEELGLMPGAGMKTGRGRAASPHSTPRDACLASSSSIYGFGIQSHLPALPFPALLKCIFISLQWELCFPLSTPIWLRRPPTRFASLANGRRAE